MSLLVRSYHAGQPSDIHAVRGLLDTVRRVIDDLQPDQIVFATEGGHGHRREMYPDYKSSRDETPDGLRRQIQLAREALDALGWPLMSVDGHEADDVLATLARQHGQQLTIASTDKDLCQLSGVCTVYDPYARQTMDSQSVGDKFGVNPHQLGDWLALVGDKSDDVPSIGPKKATQLLAEWDDLDTIIAQSVYRQRGAGKAWSSLYTHRQQALLSRRLVELAARARRGEIDPVTWWGRPVSDWAIAWYRGATGEPIAGPQPTPATASSTLFS